MALAEWGLSPEYVLSNWSWDKLSFMMERLGDRREREAKAIQGKGAAKNDDVEEVGADEFLEWWGN